MNSFHSRGWLSLTSLASMIKSIPPLSLSCFIRLALVGAAVQISAAAPGEKPVPRSWQAVSDQVYLQEIGRKVAASEPLTSVSVYEGTVYTGSTKGLYQLNGNELIEVKALREPVNRLVIAKGALWAITSPGLHRLQNSAWKKITNERVNDVCEHLGEVVVCGEGRLWRAMEATLEPVTALQSPFGITRVVSFSETLYVHAPG